MILFRIIKLLFLLIWKIIVWTFTLLMIAFALILVIVFISPDNNAGYEKDERSTQPFSDSVFYELKDQLSFHENEENHLLNVTKLKIIQNCMQKIPNSKYTRYWKDFNQNEYFESFEIQNSLVCEATYNRNHIESNSEDIQEYWRTVYSQITKLDSSKLNFFYQYFEKIKQEKELDYQEFANVIVTFIQSIPYTLILSSSKEEALRQDGFSKKYLLNNQGPYVENIKFGLFSPLEFLYSLKGDCDTRTVTLYCILSHFGYDVIVLNCLTHSMLGINLPAQGKAVKYQGKNYYFWETTGPGWQVGQIPLEYASMDWYVALPSVNNF